MTKRLAACEYCMMLGVWVLLDVHCCLMRQRRSSFPETERDHASYSGLQPLTTSTPAHSHSAFHCPPRPHPTHPTQPHPVLFSILYINTLALSAMQNTDHQTQPWAPTHASIFIFTTGCWTANQSLFRHSRHTRSAKHRERRTGERMRTNTYRHTSACTQQPHTNTNLRA